MYEDGTQNYDPEIHEEYLIHDTPFFLPHHSLAYKVLTITSRSPNLSPPAPAPKQWPRPRHLGLGGVTNHHGNQGARRTADSIISEPNTLEVW